MDLHHTVNLTTLCQTVKKVCTKILEKSDFLLAVDNDAARGVRSEIRSIIAEINMVEALAMKDAPSGDAGRTFLALAPGGADTVYNRIEICEHYLKKALKLTTPDTKATSLANILCQTPYLAPSTTLFNAVIKELQEHRRSISEELKGTLQGQLLEMRNEPGDRLGLMLSGEGELDRDLSLNPETWENWLETKVANAEGPRTKQLFAIQSQLFAKLWVDLPRDIMRVGQSLSPDICESGDRLDAKLRDALARRFSSRYTMVFVGMQSSGKSRFLNEFLGKDMLPSHGRPTTTYPCRIRHVTGKAIPELHLPKSLEDGVACLRQFNWLEKYNGFTAKPPTWTGHDLPVNVKAISLITMWQGARLVTRENYSLFMDPAFSIPAIVSGESEIKSWLQRINDLTSLCQIFHLPFESFLFDDWAVILCEYLKTSNAPTDDFCEIVDIPGLDQNHTWDEVVHEVVRTANAVVAVVSLEKFNTQSWQPTAALIASVTNVSVAAVILTKLDSERDEDDDEEDPESIVARAFWNTERESLEFKGVILPCSIIGGNAAVALLSLIEQEGQKPPFDGLLKQPYVGYWGFQDLAGARFTYGKLSLEALTIQCRDRITRMGVADAFKELHHIINDGLGNQLFSEITGIDIELKCLQKQILAGKTRARATLARESVAQNEKVLQEWSRLQRDVRENVETLITPSPLPEPDVESTARDAISFALEELLQSPAVIPSVDFDEVEALETFVTSVQRNFTTSLSAISEKKMRQLLKESRASIMKGISAMQKCVESLQPQPYHLVQPPWPAVQPLGATPGHDLLQHPEIMHKNRRLLHGRYAFYEWRRRILRKFSTTLGYSSEVGGLSRFQRVMVAVAAAITFPIRSVVGIHQTQFVLDLGAVQKSLREMGEEYREETFIKEFRQTIKSENDPIWEAAHLAIMMALAGFPDEMEGENLGKALTPAVPPPSLEKVNTVICANLGCLGLLASKLEAELMTKSGKATQ